MRSLRADAARDSLYSMGNGCGNQQSCTSCEVCERATRASSLSSSEAELMMHPSGGKLSGLFVFLMPGLRGGSLRSAL